MTWSIVARDPKEGFVGIAVASRFFACGAIVPYVGRGVAIASQAFCNPLWGLEGRDRLADGEAGADCLADLVARDEGRAMRQAHLIDAAGHIAVHTGENCVDWAGQVAADDVSVAGNMLAGPGVIDATLDTWLAMPELPFVERLLRAMDAGELAGGDKRGRQAAGLVVHRGEDYPWLDVRVDDHAVPLEELRRLVAVSEERYRQFAIGLPTRERFSGLVDRAPVDAAIERAEAERAAAGVSSRSHATPGRVSPSNSESSS